MSNIGEKKNSGFLGDGVIFRWSTGFFSLLFLVNTTASSAHAYSYDQVCGNILTAPKKSETEQKRIYCEAAKASQEGADDHLILAWVWGGVASVCALACALPSYAGVCTGASIGAGITEAALTKEFTSLLASITSFGTQCAAGACPFISGASENNSGASRGAACATSAYGIVQAVNMSMQKSKEQEANQTNLGSAAALKDTGPNVDGNTVTGNSDYGAINPGSGKPEAISQGGGQTNTNPGGNINTPENSRSICSEARANPSAGTVISCAIAKDMNIPSFVKTPQFLSDFQKYTGQSFDDFIKNSDGSPSALANAMGAPMNTELRAQISTAISDLNNRTRGGPIENDSTEGRYSSGGGGGGNTSGAGNDFDMNSMMENIMGQFMPKDGSAPKLPPGVAAVVFANKNRSPASIAEDPKLSIFDRISVRYMVLGNRMHQQASQAQTPAQKPASVPVK